MVAAVVKVLHRLSLSLWERSSGFIIIYSILYGFVFGLGGCFEDSNDGATAMGGGRD